MKMRTVLTGAVVAALATVGFTPPVARAADPVMVFQAQPVGKILADVRVITEKFGGKEALAKINDGITEKLGEKGLGGLDLTRPILGYLVNATDADTVGGIAIVPISGEKEFLDLLKRAEIDAEAVKDAKGLYALEMPEGANGDEKPIRLRFVGKYAYVGVNVEDAEMATGKLVAPEKIAFPAENSLLAVRTYAQRAPKDAAAKNQEQLKKAAEMIDGLPVPEQIKEAYAAVMKLTTRMSEQIAKEADISDIRVNLDPKSYDLVIDTVIKALPGTTLAKDIADRKPTTNRFAGMLTPDTVFGFATKLPLFTPEIRKLVAEGLKEGKKSLEDKIPEPAKAIAEAAFAGLLRTVESGSFDLALAVTGPNKDDAYGVNLGVSFEDPAAVEKEFRAALKGLPDGVQGFVKLDAAKAGTVSIHTINVGGFVPPDGQKILGDKAVVAIAFAPKGLYVSIASDAVAQVKLALAAKPAAAPVLKVVTNGKRVTDLIELSGQPIPEESAAMFDKEDKQTTAMAVSVEGGDALTIRYTIRLTPFFLVGAAKAK